MAHLFRMCHFINMTEKMPEQQPINMVGPKMLLPSGVCATPLEQDIKNSGQGGPDAKALEIMRLLGHNNSKKISKGGAMKIIDFFKENLKLPQI